MATLITLENPTSPMIKEAKAVGHYKHLDMARNYDRIEIVTVQDILEKGKRLDIPMGVAVLKEAVTHQDKMEF